MQKYKKFIRPLISFFIIIGVISGTYIWRTYRYKPLFEKYLSETYTEEMVVSTIYKGSNSGEYECYTYLKNNTEIDFYTFLKKDKASNKYIFTDHYFQALWQREVQSEIEDNIKSFIKNIHSVNFQIMGNLERDTDPIQYVFEFKGYVPKSKLPKYSEVKNSNQVKQYYKSLSLNIVGDVNDNNRESEYDENELAMINTVNDLKKMINN